MYRILQNFLALVFLTTTAQASSPGRLQVKNNTGSVVTVTDIGLDVAASATEDIDLREATQGWAASSDIDTLIDADTLDIVLDSVVLSNADAKEIIHSLRLLKVSEDSTVKTRDVNTVNFTGEVTVTDQGGGVVNVDIGSTTALAGRLLSYFFYNNGITSNKWLFFVSPSSPSNDTPFILPFNVEIISLTFSNEENNADADIQLYKNGALLTTWEIRDKRTAFDSTLSGVTLSAGDRLSAYLQNVDDSPKSPTVEVIFQITNNTKTSGGQATGD